MRPSHSLVIALLATVAVSGCRGPGIRAPEAGSPEAPVALKPAASRPPSPAQPAPGETLRIDDDLVARRIGPRTWVITHELPLSANALVAEASDGRLLLVDTPWTPEATESLLAWLDERFGSPEIAAINTHFHLDALGGNPALRDAGIGARGLVATARLLRERGRERLDQLVGSLQDPEQKALFRNAELLPPSSQYMAARFGMPFGDERYQLIHPGPGHSPDNLVVYFPNRELLFGGCLVKGGGSLGFLGDADLERWPGAIRRLQSLDLETVVPGHGPRTDPGLLDHTLALLQEARDRE